MTPYLIRTLSDVVLDLETYVNEYHRAATQSDAMVEEIYRTIKRYLTSELSWITKVACISYCCPIIQPVKTSSQRLRITFGCELELKENQEKSLPVKTIKTRTM